VPTVFGRVVIERGALLVRDANALRAELQALAGLDTGRLDIAGGPYVAEDLVGPAVARLVSEHPGLRVRVTVVGPDQVESEVLSGRHDLGLGGIESQTPHDELTIVPLRKRRLFMACRAGHPLLGCRPTREQVTSFPFVTVLMRGETARAATTGAALVRRTCCARDSSPPSK
jgi:DNA-binding transcriptional LysR family regulator